MPHFFERTRSNAFLRNILSAAVAIASMVSAAQAHFIWVVATLSKYPTTAKVYLSEVAGPDDPELLSHIAGAKTWAVGGRGKPHELTWKVTP